MLQAALAGVHLEKFSRGGQKWNVVDVGGGGGHCTKGALCTPHARRTGGMLPQENINIHPEITLRLFLVLFQVCCVLLCCVNFADTVNYTCM